jgi:hypothetical protein
MTRQLEPRYRRMIALYPPGHRAVFAEDMIGVLMDDARPEQARPRLGTTYDVLKGATAAWLQRLQAGGRAWQHSSAPAAISLIALLILTTKSFGAVGMILDDSQNSSHGFWGELGMQLSRLSWLPVAATALLGFRRFAAWTAWGLGVILPVIGWLVMFGGWTPGYLGRVDSTLWFVVTLIAAAGLSAERQQSNGIRDLGRRGTIEATIEVLIIGGLVLLWNVPRGSDLIDPWRYRLGLPLLVIGVVLVTVSCVRAIAPLGRVQAQVTTAAIALPLLVHGFYGFRGGDGWRFENWMELEYMALPLVVLGCSLLVAWPMVGAAPGLLARGRSGPEVQPHSG